jgi:hypothetical protein
MIYITSKDFKKGRGLRGTVGSPAIKLILDQN